MPPRGRSRASCSQTAVTCSALRVSWQRCTPRSSLTTSPPGCLWPPQPSRALSCPKQQERLGQRYPLELRSVPSTHIVDSCCVFLSISVVKTCPTTCPHHGHSAPQHPLLEMIIGPPHARSLGSCGLGLTVHLSPPEGPPGAPLTLTSLRSDLRTPRSSDQAACRLVRDAASWSPCNHDGLDQARGKGPGNNNVNIPRQRRNSFGSLT